MVRRLLGETRGIIEREVAVHLVCRNVMIADIVFATRLEQAVRTLDVRAQERLRVGNGVVVMALRRVMDDSVVPRNDAVKQLRITDVAHHKLHAVFGQTGDVLGVASIGELVEHRHMHAGAVVHHIVDEVAADESTASGDDDVRGVENLLGHDAPWIGYLAIVCSHMQ